MTRLLDILFSFFGLLLGLPVLILLTALALFDTGSPFFRQERVGRYQKPFTLIKFRTMHPDTASVATHLADASSVTRYGSFLRHTKLDELPQLWNVLLGQMSMVGPRPCLYNQHELIDEREARNVFSVRPGITGLAQIYHIDMSTPTLLAETDAKMLSNLNFIYYLKYLMLTLKGKGSGDKIKSP